MSILVEDEQKTVQEGLNVLTKHLPPSKVARLLSIWRVGDGDYAKERRKLFVGKSVGDLFRAASSIEKRGRKR
jgi:hypothetical protein